MKTKREIAEILHNVYEEESKRVGWKTQESCRVEFKDLPEKNKQVMRKIAEVVMELIEEGRDDMYNYIML